MSASSNIGSSNWQMKTSHLHRSTSKIVRRCLSFRPVPIRCGAESGRPGRRPIQHGEPPCLYDDQCNGEFQSAGRNAATGYRQICPCLDVISVCRTADAISGRLARQHAHLSLRGIKKIRRSNGVCLPSLVRNRRVRLPVLYGLWTSRSARHVHFPFH